MFAARTNWPLKKNALTSALEEFQKNGAEILDLTESNPTRAGFHYPASLLEKLTHPLNKIYTPSPQGLLEARKTIAGYYSAKGLPVPPENIFLSSGTSEIYSFLFRLLLNPGERILVPRPGYPLFEILAGLNDVETLSYPLEYDSGWRIDFPRLEELLDSSVKALVLVNPNNPTGSYLKKEELKKLNKLANEKKLALISDEVFFDYSWTDRSPGISLASNQDALSFTLNGISKMLALPQMKLGWLVVSGPEELVCAAREKLEIIYDSYLTAGTPVQRALTSWLPLSTSLGTEIKNRLSSNLLFLKEKLKDVPSAELLQTEGGWYATVRLPRIRSEEDWALLFLREDSVYVHPGYFFDFEQEAYIVLSLLCQAELFQEGVDKVLKRVRISEKEG